MVRKIDERDDDDVSEMVLTKYRQKEQFPDYDGHEDDGVSEMVRVVEDDDDDSSDVSELENLSVLKADMVSCSDGTEFNRVSQYRGSEATVMERVSKFHDSAAVERRVSQFSNASSATDMQRVSEFRGHSKNHFSGLARMSVNTDIARLEASDSEEDDEIKRH